MRERDRHINLAARIRAAPAKLNSVCVHCIWTDETSIRLFACWFQSGLINQPIMFFFHNKPAPTGLISLETNQQTG